MGRGIYENTKITPRQIEPKQKSARTKKPSRLLSTAEAARYLGISDTTFRKYRKLGQIPFRRVGTKLYKFEPADLDAFARKITMFSTKSTG